MTPEIYISVDIETSGPIVGWHSLLSLGACVCSDVTRTFRRDIAPISDAVEDAAMAVVGKPLDHYRREGVLPGDAFTDFRIWVTDMAAKSQPVFVGFNAAFDWGFVNWYFLSFAGHNPFGVAPLDIKAYYAGFAGVLWQETRSSKIPDHFKPVRDHTHDALGDAVEQGLMFMQIRAAAAGRA